MVLLFWGSVALVTYTYFGYPLYLWLLARASAQPIARGAPRPKVVMVVVAHNEAGRIAAKLQTCLAQDYPAELLRVLVVCDGSTDGTPDLALADVSGRVSVLAMPQRRGKAACLNDAVAASGEEVIVFTDARQKLSPDAVSRLLAHFADPEVGAVSGELEFVDAEGLPFAGGIGAYWRYEKFIRRHESATGSVVGVTGALYALRRECFQAIAPDTILDDVAIPMVAAMQGWRVTFESGALAYDVPSATPAKEQVRKVRTLAGNFQLVAHFPRLLSPLHNPLWLRFVSHKFLRLVVPLLLLLALATNAWLAIDSPGYRVMLAAQGLGWVLALSGMAIPALQRNRGIALLVTFAHLNVYVVQGLFSFLTSHPMHLWKSGTDRVDPSALPGRNSP